MKETKFSINAETVILKAGDFCIVKKGSKFSYQNDSEQNAVIILFILQILIYRRNEHIRTRKILIITS
jgi:quercetin dioxygenase-like cupin family protein